MKFLIDQYFPEYKRDPEKLEELNAYQSDLDILARHKISIQFTNKGREHAIQVMSKIFEHAYRHVKIFARDFNGAISDNALYLESLRDFLTKNDKTRVDVIFENEPNKNSRALALLKDYAKGGRVNIRKAVPDQLAEFRANLVNREQMIHFAIADDEQKGFNMYRCETDTKNYVAILNFDDPRFCQRLLNLYRILEKQAVTV